MKNNISAVLSLSVAGLIIAFMMSGCCDGGGCPFTKTAGDKSACATKAGDKDCGKACAVKAEGTKDCGSACKPTDSAKATTSPKSSSN